MLKLKIAKAFFYAEATVASPPAVYAAELAFQCTLWKCTNWQNDVQSVIL